jgi:hypothetical protein
MNEATMLIVCVATKQIEFLIHSQCSLKAQVSTRRTTNEGVIRFRFQLWEVVLHPKYDFHYTLLNKSSILYCQ